MGPTLSKEQKAQRAVTQTAQKALDVAREAKLAEARKAKEAAEASAAAARQAAEAQRKVDEAKAAAARAGADTTTVDIYLNVGPNAASRAVGELLYPPRREEVYKVDFSNYNFDGTPARHSAITMQRRCQNNTVPASASSIRRRNGKYEIWLKRPFVENAKVDGSDKREWLRTYGFQPSDNFGANWYMEFDSYERAMFTINQLLNLYRSSAAYISVIHLPTAKCQAIYYVTADNLKNAQFQNTDKPKVESSKPQDDGALDATYAADATSATEASAGCPCPDAVRRIYDESRGALYGKALTY